LWRTPKASCAAHSGRTVPPKPGQTLHLDVQVNNPRYWPTPVADDTGHRRDPYLQGGTALSTVAGGQLNPEWVEALMGYPIGWTELDS
jgi:hypothetical protein